MDVPASPESCLDIAVDELKPGMFLTAICRQVGHQLVKSPGPISQRQIDELRSHGVSRVRIDPSRSESDTLPCDAVEQPGVMPPKPVSLQRAMKVFNEAKGIQHDYFVRIGKGEAIDLKPLEQAADELVDGLGHNSDALLCLARIREKDRYLMEHSFNVGMLLAYFGRFLGMDRNLQKELMVGGMLHDIGKVETPDEVLNKPGKLTDEEFAIMRQHVVYSREILMATPGMTQVMLDIASNHHEKFDGTGYPAGLTKEQLSIYSRMSTIVDCYDALTADRVYKSGMPPTAAFRIMLQQMEANFDHRLLEQFIRCMGVYPAGTWVELTSGKIGMVIERNPDKPLLPVVRVVYHSHHHHYLPVVACNLAKMDGETIERVVNAEEFGIDIRRFTDR